MQERSEFSWLSQGGSTRHVLREYLVMTDEVWYIIDVINLEEWEKGYFRIMEL